MLLAERGEHEEARRLWLRAAQTGDETAATNLRTLDAMRSEARTGARPDDPV